MGSSIESIDAIITNKKDHVNKLKIPKKDGTLRSLLAPSVELKYIQKSVYYQLFKRYRANDAAHGFVANRGIVTNAEPHVGAKSLGKIDISSFFDSIGVEHLMNCLFGNKQVCRMCNKYERMLDGKCNPSIYHNRSKSFDHGCEELKAVYIPEYCAATGYESLFKRVIEVCTFNGFAAQGFPTSPVLANIVMRGFDISMTKHCEEHGIVYTRYADDLSFSSKVLSKNELRDSVKDKAYSLLWAYGFKPNIKKTKWKQNYGMLKVCGVVVNVKTSVQKFVLKRFRAQVHHATVKFASTTTPSRIRQLKGYASFVMSIDKAKGEKYMKQLTDFEARNG